MGLQDSLSRLMERMSDPPHPYQPSILSFPQLDIQKISRDLKLRDRGAERGRANRPPEDRDSFDVAENEIVEFIEGEVKKAHETLLNERSTYIERLNALDLDGYLSRIKAAAMEGISSFRSRVSQGLDHLFSFRKPVRELTKEMGDFRKEHKLKRTANYPSTRYLQWGIVAVLFLAETVLNGGLLAEGSEYGFIGGVIVALAIAFLNVGVSLGLGWYGLRQCWHNRPWRRTVGYASLILWFLGAAAFNLCVGHYRGAASKLLEGGGIAALQTFWANPFALNEFQSFVLVGIGALFALIAFIDGLFMDDLYPSYGDLDRRLVKARRDYASERHLVISELEEIKKSTTEAMQFARNELGKRRGEYGSILAGLDQVSHAYEQHISYLEGAGNALLTTYRDANCEMRQDRAPKHFNKGWEVMRPPLDSVLLSQVMPQEQLNNAIVQAKNSLHERLEEVHSEYEQAFQKYHSLDDLDGGEDAQAVQ